MCATWLNWESGFDYKILISKYRHMEMFFSLARDRDTGSILVDPDSGVPRVIYTPSAFDRRHIMTGLIALAKIFYIQGALEIHPCLPGLRPFMRADVKQNTTEDTAKPSLDAGIMDASFQAWLEEMEAHGNKSPETPFASAHQMGTCRMSLDEKSGVVNSEGKVWGTEGLYVADASTFPSASGVNPMITIMAISDWVSRGLVQELAREPVQTAKM